jgi:hypothetical protein
VKVVLSAVRDNEPHHLLYAHNYAGKWVGVGLGLGYLGISPNPTLHQPVDHTLLLGQGWVSSWRARARVGLALGRLGLGLGYLLVGWARVGLCTNWVRVI